LRLKGLVRVSEGKTPLLIESVGTLFSPPRPLRQTDPSQASFLVVIARDVSKADLATIAPAGLFSFSSWRKPEDALAGDNRRTIKAEWVG
jgi:hypothetical protein